MEIVIILSILVLIPIQIMINKRRDRIYHLFSTIVKEKIVSFNKIILMNWNIINNYSKNLKK